MRYTKIMVNVHKIIRWHKENQNVNKCKVED